MTEPYLCDKRVCPARGSWISFRFVDEFGDGKPYAGLAYELTDSEGEKTEGNLDSDGYAKVSDNYKGPVTLSLAKPYAGGDKWYEDLADRKNYRLPLTDFQVAAEQTLHRPIGSAAKSGAYRASSEKAEFYNVEVRQFVKYSRHLPTAAKLSKPVPYGWTKLACDFGKNKVPDYGTALLPDKHYVLEVRALRAYRPLISLSPKFSAINLYHMSLFATLSYAPFGQFPLDPNAPKDPKDEKSREPGGEISFPVVGSIGHVLQTCLACHEEPMRYADSKTPNYPIVEDVPYSKRLEIVPYDPKTYIADDEQETPSQVHFFSDERQGMTDWKNTDTQAFATHDDRMILIAVRGTAEKWDAWRDGDAMQVPVEDGVGKAHQGFHEGYVAVKKFAIKYLDRFRTGNQRIMVCGHSLGGAIALLLAAWIRNNYDENVILYTFGAPRAGDATFVESAKGLIHHRIVNNNDPVPSVPAGWMDTKKAVWITGVAATVTGGVAPVVGGLVFGAGLSRFGGEPYRHQGEQRYFMPLRLPGNQVSSILWTPGCEGYEESAMTQLCYANLKNNDTPDRKSLAVQALNAGDHTMLSGYIPACWATLRRWQDTQTSGGNILTAREAVNLRTQLENYRSALEQWQQAQRVEFPGRTIEGRPQDRATATQRRSTMSDLQSRQKEIDLAIRHNENEMVDISESLARIGSLESTQLNIADVYGDRADLPELKKHVERWAAHKENQAVVRIAQIPQDAMSSTA
ncbi:lipase family protein [Pseudomonas sp. PSE1(2024)]|uniref:lipase family protein n=1 Tax=Pseudomonas sp. PSE1(2024) TaxID=3228746 RepID=UPI003D989C7B